MITTKQQTKIRPSVQSLSQIVSLVCKENDIGYDTDILNLIKKDFPNIDVSLDDINQLFAINREEEETKLWYKYIH
jgi:hypothetical protein